MQKCVRTGDIEEVGKTSRHGTFFQMNGNFSFGDYFKEGAISLAWELVTTPQAHGGYGLDADLIWPTVYEDDDEAFAIWRDTIGVPEARITRRGKLDNYWHMGVPGPGGPCSEIYLDRGPEYGPEGGPAVDEDRYLEFWNLVFMQEELSAVRAKDDFDISGPLPKRNIDTGMGLERMATLLQGVDNLYEIDEVYPVIDRAAEMTGKRYGEHSGHSAGSSHPDDVRLRVVADHVRSSLMLIGDGVTPGNEGRGYVLRRMLRRSVRSMRLLGYDDPCLPELLPVSLERMKQSYPELETGFDRIAQIAYAEEEAFRRTLAAGTTILDTKASAALQAHASATAEAGAAGTPTLSAADAFQLHDTYGFPIDLTLEMAAEQGLEVDREGFAHLMREQRQRAKADAKSKKSGHANTEVWRDLRANGATDFLAYQELTSEATVIGLVVDGVAVERDRAGPARSGGAQPQPLLRGVRWPGRRRGRHHGRRRAPARGRRAAPGQGPDRAHRRGRDRPAAHRRERAGGGRPRVAAVRVPGALRHARRARGAAPGARPVGPAVRLLQQARLPAARLRVGPGPVGGDPQRDRGGRQPRGAQGPPRVGDLHAAAAGPRDRGPGAVRRDLRRGRARRRDRRRRGAASSAVAPTCSTPARSGPLTITGESSVGSGVRRVEAFVGIDALRYLAKERAIVAELTGLVGARPDELAERVGAMVTRLKDAERELERARREQVQAAAGNLTERARDVNGVTYLGHDAGDAGADDVRTMVLDLRGRLGAERPSVVAITGAAKGRPVVVVATNELARERGIRAGELVRVAATALGGGGGGKDDIAQGGGQDASKVGDALAAVEWRVGELAG